jgi:hypothetical protein
MCRPRPNRGCTADDADDDNIFIYMNRIKLTLSQFVYFIITYYFLQNISAHLTHHQAEPNTRKT